MADELDIVLNDIDEIEVDASASDEIEITISEVDDIEIMVFDYPAEIDLLTERVKTCEENSTDAISIAEQSAVMAGEAVQTVGEHVETITNPHPSNITQNFDGVNINGLKLIDTGGSISSDIYNWFKGLFPALVDSSVFSFFVGILTILKDLAKRVGLLEDKYILKYVVPADCITIDLTEDKYGNAFNFVEGDEIDIALEVVPFVGGGSNRVNLRVNNIATSNYLWATLKNTVFGFTGSSYYGHSGSMVLKIINKRVLMKVFSHVYITSSSYTNATYEGYIDLDIDSINSLNFSLSSSLYPIPAGTTIIIKRK